MSDQKFWRSEHEEMSSVETAIDYTRSLIKKEMSGTGDFEPALYRLEAKTGIGFWTLHRLWHGRRKLVDRDLFVRIRGAYLALCALKVTALSNELAFEQARSGDDTFADLAAEAEILIAKIKAARERGR